jgi:transposase
MSIGKRLQEREQGKIDALKAEGYSNREIAKKIKRSANVVNNYLKLGKKMASKGVEVENRV